jgi:hypothetical protein
VSYCRLNCFTKPFTYPFPRFADAIEDLSELAFLILWFISMDCRQGFHQILIQEKNAFLMPDGDTECFTVMSCGPTDGSSTYTATMFELRQEWIALFKSMFPEHIHLVANIRMMIDNILNWCTNPDALVDLFEYICIVFLKYRKSFRLDTCIFFKERFEYVGHDITSAGNCPAQSKFDMIQNWPRPTTAKSLLSCISLRSFYQCYAPWFEVGVQEMRRMVRTYSRCAILDEEWTEYRTTLFDSMKTALTSPPLLRRFDSSRPVFLKTDWSAAGMGFVLMQPDGREESTKAMTTLQAREDNAFDSAMSGAHLKPVRFGSRKCNDREEHYHSMVGEATCDRWAFGKLRHLLWGIHFFWLCDCDAVK